MSTKAAQCPGEILGVARNLHFAEDLTFLVDNANGGLFY
jgi:hypothetical protein